MKTSSRPSSLPLSPDHSADEGGVCGPRGAETIDAHVHVFPPEMIKDRSAYLGIDKRFDTLYSSSAAHMARVEDVLEQMEQCGVGLSVVFGFAFCDIRLCRQVNDYVIEAVKAHPERLAALACVPCGSVEAAAELERCLDAGLCGCGELAPVSGDAEEIAGLAGVAEVLRERGLPLLVHASEPVGHEYPGKGHFTPEACVRLAQAYPGLDIVLSHLGGGAFVYELMPEVKEAMARVYYDTAAVPYLYSQEVFEVVTTAVGAQKLIFGSDYPLLDPVRCAQGLERLSAEDQQAVRADNARKVFGL